jgi:curli biogenesis system outer membrane secretion channel CsgG
MKRVSSLAICGALLLALLAAPGLTRAASKVSKGGSTKPRIAVLEFKNKADNQWWFHGGATAAQDVFVTELVKSGKFRVVEREQLEELMKEKGLSLSGDVDPSTAIRIGKLLGVNYLLAGAVTEYGNTNVGGGGGGVFAGKKKFVAALNARLIDTSTGEIAWADEANQEETSVKVSVFGYGGGVDDERMFDKVMKPCIQKLVASLKAADL